MKRYSNNRLLLQRDVLALHSGEAKAHYNIVQALSKIVLSEAWLTKSLYNELWRTIYSKGWGDPWHSPLWQFNYPHDSSPTLWLLHSLLRLDLHLTWLNITMHMYSCETTWLEQALQDITNTQSVVTRPTLWHACDGEGGDLIPILIIRDGVNAPHGDILLKRTLASIATMHWFDPFIQLIY